MFPIPDLPTLKQKPVYLCLHCHGYADELEKKEKENRTELRLADKEEGYLCIR